MLCTASLCRPSRRACASRRRSSLTANEGRPQLAPSARLGQNARGNDGGMSSLAQAAQAISGEEEEEGEKKKEEEDDDEDEDEEYAEGLIRNEPPKRAQGGFKIVGPRLRTHRTYST
ncbi:hypothetical protein T492DRAFT_915028 [Pavlovales sp. CCMP2436]|nr:hypothetical protein T492DRAFT_915028 [Pavlovales sp. CCMP2436]